MIEKAVLACEPHPTVAGPAHTIAAAVPTHVGVPAEPRDHAAFERISLPALPPPSATLRTTLPVAMLRSPTLVTLPTFRRSTGTAVIQREPDDDFAPLAEPLADGERQSIRIFLAEGYAGAHSLTKDPDTNAVLIAAQLANYRGGMRWGQLWELLPSSEEHMAKLIEHVRAAGPLTQEQMAAEWGKVAPADRIRYVMRKLVVYGYPPHSAAGIVGNLLVESGLIPPRIESILNDERPLTGRNRAGKTVDFTARDLMENSVPGLKPDPDKVLPEKTGLGLAQWTDPKLRAGMFQHNYQGRQGPIILFDMDAQIDYLVSLLKTKPFLQLDQALRNPAPGGSKEFNLKRASELFLRVFENPADVEGKVSKRLERARDALTQYERPDPTSSPEVQQAVDSSRPSGLEDREAVHATAREGLSGAVGAMPHLEAIQRSFGRHDLTNVRAHVDGRAAASAQAMGARAFTTDEDIVFADAAPSLHTAAHEAAHVIQQRAGVHLPGGVGKVGDEYERHADAVAELVVHGQSTDGLLDRFSSGAGRLADPGAIQQQGPSSRPPVATENGEPLDAALRKQMEARIGCSLDGVRVHTDARANLLTSALGSAAFTVRDDVFFGPGMYAPGTPPGDRLLAHELTHVAQGQRGGHAAARGSAMVAPEHAPAEVEAGCVVRGERIGAPSARHAHVIHRQPLRPESTSEWTISPYRQPRRPESTPERTNSSAAPPGSRTVTPLEREKIFEWWRLWMGREREPGAPIPNFMSAVPPETVRHIKVLTDVAAAASDAAAKDEVVDWVVNHLGAFAEVLANIAGEVSKYVVDRNLKELDLEPEDLGEPPKPNEPEKPGEPLPHTGPERPKDPEEYTATMTVSRERVPEQRHYLFELRKLESSYKPHALIAFELLTPHDFVPYSWTSRGRVVLLALDDYKKNGVQASALDSQNIGSKGKVAMSLTAPEQEGTYVLAVRVGLKMEFDTVSREFKVAKPVRPPGGASVVPCPIE